MSTSVTKLSGPTFAQLFPGVPEYQDGRPTSEFREYMRARVIAADRRAMAFDAAPKAPTAKTTIPDAIHSPEGRKDDDSDPLKFFNGRSYQDGKRLYDEYLASRGR